MDLDRETLDMLRPAAEHLRRVLQRLDEEDVPAALRRFAESSDRRIPAPILRRALDELDGSEWLRAEVAAEVELEPGSPEELFVSRPDGWEERLGELAGRAAKRQKTRSLAALERQLSEANERMRQLEKRLKSDAARLESAERDAEERWRARLDAVERSRRDAEGKLRDAEREAAALAGQMKGKEGEVAELESRVETLRQLLEKERRAGSTLPPPTPAKGSFPEVPEEMAVELDRILSALRLPPRTADTEKVGAPALRLPGDLRPDRIESVHWLLRRPGRWLIDGYNVAFRLTAHPDATTRTRIVSAAQQLATLSPPGSGAVIVFDSTVDRGSFPSRRRVRLVFEESADEWIIAHARPGCVAVSSDRRVREAAEAAGAVGIWSEAFAAWIEAGCTLGP